MILLSFTVRNHASVRDEITLDLTHPSLRTLQPKDSDWSGASYPLAGIFGGNATGKSSVLDALRYVFVAIQLSATSWQASKSMQRAPFQLDGTARSSSSSYELDFVYDGRRHLYSFEVDAEGIKRERMRDVPNSRWRTLLDRDREEGKLAFHPELQGRIEVAPRELVLSRALMLRETRLYGIAQELVTHFDAVLVKDSHREARLRDIADSLAENTITFADLEALLQVADIGIMKVDIEERDIPERVRRALRNLKRDLRDVEEVEEVETGELDPDQREQVIRHLVFSHRGTVDECPAFSIRDESDGTIAWLATAVPALQTLRRGGLLVVDEIDASLHPHLLEILLGAFEDSSVNTEHAQLIFTSHETYVLSPISEVQLAPEQVWFTDKSYEGVTEMACLADLPRHPDANVSRRYLLGRYAGTPRLSPSSLAVLVESGKG